MSKFNIGSSVKISEDWSTEDSSITKDIIEPAVGKATYGYYEIEKFIS